MRPLKKRNDLKEGFGMSNTIGNLYGMKESVQIDGAGRVVLPKPLRQRFRLHGGDFLTLQIKGDVIELRPAKAGPTLKRVNGVLVHGGDEKLPNRDFVEEAREERIADLIRRGVD
jgi:AbrB family looped-hinge helix DNA binding protein